MPRPSPAMLWYRLRHPLHSEPLLTLAALAVINMVLLSVFADSPLWVYVVIGVIWLFLGRLLVTAPRGLQEASAEHGEDESLWVDVDVGSG